VLLLSALIKDEQSMSQRTGVKFLGTTVNGGELPFSFFHFIFFFSLCPTFAVFLPQLDDLLFTRES